MREWGKWVKRSGKYRLLVMEEISHRNERYNIGNIVNGIVIVAMVPDGSYTRDE